MVKILGNYAFQRTLLTLIILILSVQNNYTFAQSGDYYYRITFRDKGNNTVNSFEAEELMSERAVNAEEKPNYFSTTTICLYGKNILTGYALWDSGFILPRNG